MKAMIKYFLISLFQIIVAFNQSGSEAIRLRMKRHLDGRGESTIGIADRLFDKVASMDWCDGNFQYSIGCALYYCNLGRNVPLYLHIDLRTDNEHCFALWWFASTI